MKRKILLRILQELWIMRLPILMRLNNLVTQEQLQAIEDLVNEQIRRNTSAETKLMTYDDAVDSGAMALFGEKYDDEVRVLRLGDGFSVELCGGTHVDSTGRLACSRSRPRAASRPAFGASRLSRARSPWTGSTPTSDHSITLPDY